MSLLMHNVNVNLICRVCLNSNIDLHNIFIKNEFFCTIAISLMECAPVEISPEDGLPHQICTECLQKLQSVQQFKNQIITSDITLRQCLQNINETKPDLGIDYNNEDPEPIEIKPDIHLGLDNDHVKKEDIPAASDDSKEDLKPTNLNVCDGTDELDMRNPRKRTKYDRSRGGPFKCDQCGLTCTRKSNLALHKRVHTGERPHICDFCGKSFASRSYLVIHRRIHTKEYRLQCDFCGKQFVHSAEYKDHRRIHTGERPYKCDECERSFKQISQLRVHKTRVHEELFNFECDICQKRFKTKFVMTRHKRVHTGERPFECSICLKKFAENAGLIRHSRTVHKNSSATLISLKIKEEEK